jgi:hypothetical protein
MICLPDQFKIIQLLESTELTISVYCLISSFDFNLPAKFTELTNMTPKD